jgi:hypothetical protein
MNTVQLREAIERAAHEATALEPHETGDIGIRAQFFVATLTGILAIEEPALSNVVRGLLNLPATTSAVPTSTGA